MEVHAHFPSSSSFLLLDCEGRDCDGFSYNHHYYDHRRRRSNPLTMMMVVTMTRMSIHWYVPIVVRLVEEVVVGVVVIVWYEDERSAWFETCISLAVVVW